MFMSTHSSVAALPGVPTACNSYGELCGLSGSSAYGISCAGGLSVTLPQQQPSFLHTVNADKSVKAADRQKRKCLHQTPYTFKFNNLHGLRHAMP